MSSASATTRDDLVPRAGSNSNSVTTGPGLISRTSPLIAEVGEHLFQEARGTAQHRLRQLAARLAGCGPAQEVHRRRAVGRRGALSREAAKQSSLARVAARRSRRPRRMRQAQVQDARPNSARNARRWRGFRHPCSRRSRLAVRAHAAGRPRRARLSGDRRLSAPQDARHRRWNVEYRGFWRLRPSSGGSSGR